MSNTNPSISGPAEGARRATGARGGNRPRGQGPLVCQAQSECRSGAASWRRSGVDGRKCGVTAATLTEWRDAFLAAGAEALKIRQEDVVDEQGRRPLSLPGSARRLATEMKPSWPRSGAPSRSRPSMAKGIAKSGPGCVFATCAPRCGACCC